ncbi:uncharacterized protein LOC113003070 [Solenopsis invicta]|uniref:uncharacterized protein LOC113003070 n=1 Tax=Solenopsis invicta TaxID=13686 RepID=UPI00193DEDA2|nr:uncharacterized protein LOC113003070 [Solenopsis invicta]
MIGVIELKDRHTSDKLELWLLEIVQNWDINLESIVVVVSDNASNITKAIENVFGKEKRVVLSDLLREHSDLKLIQSVETRWNSTFDMLHRFIQLSDKIGLILLQHPTAPSMLTALELQTVREFVQLLEPFKTATTMLSGEMYVTGSQVIPILHTLANQLELCKPISEEGQRMKVILTQELQARFRNVESNSLLAIATILDHRFKKIHFVDKIACSHAVNKITNILNTTNQENIQEQEENNLSESVNQSGAFWAYHDVLIKRCKERVAFTSANNEMPDEFRYYINQIPININECPLKYWQNQSFSSLATLAKRY